MKTKDKKLANPSNITGLNRDLILIEQNEKKISEFNKLERNSQLLVETPSAKAAPTRLDRCADKSKDLSMCDKTLSTATNGIIAISNIQSQTHKSNSTKISQSKQKSNTNEISL